MIGVVDDGKKFRKLKIISKLFTVIINASFFFLLLPLLLLFFLQVCGMFLDPTNGTGIMDVGIDIMDRWIASI